MRMETLNWGSASKTARMEGPSLPPAPSRITFLICEDISEWREDRWMMFSRI